jgi:hypothetical protein
VSPRRASTACASGAAARARHAAPRLRDPLRCGSRDRSPDTGTASLPGTAARGSPRRRRQVATCRQNAFVDRRSSDRAGRPQHQRDDDEQGRGDDPRISAVCDTGTERVVAHALTVPVVSRPIPNASCATQPSRKVGRGAASPASRACRPVLLGAMRAILHRQVSRARGAHRFAVRLTNPTQPGVVPLPRCAADRA